MTYPQDVQGKMFQVGQKVAVPKSLYAGGSCYVEIKTVTRVTDSKVYLDNSNKALTYTDRVAIVD